MPETIDQAGGDDAAKVVRMPSTDGAKKRLRRLARRTLEGGAQAAQAADAAVADAGQAVADLGAAASNAVNAGTKVAGSVSNLALWVLAGLVAMYLLGD